MTESGGQQGMPTNTSETGEAAGRPSSDFGRYAKIGLLVLLVVFGIFGVWAATAPLSGAVIAPGEMVVSSNTKTIKHRQGGIVRGIHVREGDVVKDGQRLVELDPTEVRAQLDQLRAQKVMNQARKARLEAEAEGADAVTFPQDLSSASYPRIDVAGVMATERLIFNSRRAALESQLEQSTKRINRLRVQISGLRDVIDSLEKQVASYEEEIAERSELYEDKLANKQELRRAKRRKLELQGQLASRRSEIARRQADIGAARTERRLAQRQYDQEVSTRLGETRAKLMQAASRIPAMEQRLERTTVRSPVAGQVVGLQVHTTGGVVSAGDALMKIVPEQEGLVVRARVPPADIDNVKAGQEVRLRFQALNTSLAQQIYGTVESVSSDTLRQDQNSEPYYLARVKVNEDGKRRLEEAGFDLQPGMPVTAMIQTGDRTLVSYMMDPIRDMMSRSMKDP